MSEEHPIEQPITSICISCREYDQEQYIVGIDGVTRIDAVIKPGMYSNIPYVRAWKGDVCIGEWCQHAIVGVYFVDPTPRPMPEGHIDSPTCTCIECVPF